MDNALIIFIKNPVEGNVKTRLAKDIGHPHALMIYKYLLAHTRNISSCVPANRLLFYDDRPVRDEWSEYKFEKFSQSGENLGSRMFNAFQTAATKKNNRIIIVGSDCIQLTAELINTAFNYLEHNDFVIGPAKDGGYYLLGMKYPEERLFINKRWSTHTVFSDTLQDIKEMSKTVSVLPVLSDIDTSADLNKELLDLITTR